MRPVTTLCLTTLLLAGAVYFYPRPAAAPESAATPPVREASDLSPPARALPTTRSLVPSFASRTRSPLPPPSIRRPRATTPLVVSHPTGTFRSEPATTPSQLLLAPEESIAFDDEPLIPLPLARAALELVGSDADADDVWVAAINDPALSDEDRSDLIEDLNEVGIDPKNLTPDDLPLIVSRLGMIEDLAPDAMDQTNLDAFNEAYKDLLNMYNRLTGPQP
jgi:hypothetical protein